MNTWADRDYHTGAVRRVSLKITSYPGSEPCDINILMGLQGIAVVTNKVEQSCVQDYNITNMSDITDVHLPYKNVVVSRFVTILIKYPVDPYAYPKLCTLAENELCQLVDDRIEQHCTWFNDDKNPTSDGEYNWNAGLNKKDTYSHTPLPEIKPPFQRYFYTVSYYQIPNDHLERFYKNLGVAEGIRAHVVIDARSESTHVYFKVLSDTPPQIAGFDQYIYSSEAMYRAGESLSALISRFHRNSKIPVPEEKRDEPRERRVRLV